MKPTYVLLKVTSQPAVAVALNTQDIKTITISGDQVTIATSADSHTMTASQYAQDRIKSELRERYNMALLSTAGFSIQDSRKDNTILTVKTENSSVLIFPKALQAIGVTGNAVTVAAYGLRPAIRVVTTSDPNLGDTIRQALGASIV